MDQKLQPESLRAKIFGWAVLIIAPLAYGMTLVPSDGVACFAGGSWAVNGLGKLEECANLRERIGATCNVRTPHCFFVQWPAEVRARAEAKGIPWPYD